MNVWAVLGLLHMQQPLCGLRFESWLKGSIAASTE